MKTPYKIGEKIICINKINDFTRYTIGKTYEVCEVPSRLNPNFRPAIQILVLKMILILVLYQIGVNLLVLKN